ncbi:recombinase family protein [Peribacillus frigoritolerans]|uniref:Recombinase family protein n=1 Tax=Peribacillus frigoritolerans TaxID=450367 RepID=A0AAJ1QKL0_9BACI|nr:recombinase family protein [Peribacillus frigoritolerans]MDM5283103.1 recombinase family protein [Peribacillus frigoritolerans]
MTHDIKDVAIYLRKSRDETNGLTNVLEKHENELTTFAAARNWKTTIYKEIASAESIDSRPEMVRMLKDVRAFLYDAVLVMEYDRLSRGSQYEAGLISDAFKSTETLIVTPTRVYDLANNEADEMLSEFESVIARNEYRQIKKRMARGKVHGAKLGKWTQGIPPLPYVYDSKTKNIYVDEEKRPLYQRIKRLFLEEKMSCLEITLLLNREGVKSPTGKTWVQATVYRLLLSEIHCGKIVYGKRKHDAGGKLRNVPREDWIITQGTHEIVKTEEEHAQIVKTLNERRLLPHAAKRGAFVLSGLVKCAKCGRFHQMTTNGKGTIYVRKCSKANPDGTRCNNTGIKEDIVFRMIENAFIDFEIQLMNSQNEIDTSVEESIKAEWDAKLLQLQKINKRIDRLKEAYLDGAFDRHEFRESKAKEDEKIEILQVEISELEREADFLTKETNEERLARLRKWKNQFKPHDEDKAKMNKILKQIIRELLYNKDGDDISLQVKWT